MDYKHTLVKFCSTLLYITTIWELKLGYHMCYFIGFVWQDRNEFSGRKDDLKC